MTDESSRPSPWTDAQGEEPRTIPCFYVGDDGQFRGWFQLRTGLPPEEQKRRVLALARHCGWGPGRAYLDTRISMQFNESEVTP